MFEQYVGRSRRRKTGTFNDSFHNAWVNVSDENTGYAASYMYTKNNRCCTDRKKDQNLGQQKYNKPNDRPTVI